MVEQSENMAPRKKKRPFPSSSSNMAEPPQTEKKASSSSSSSSMTPDWTQLPEELLHIITEKLDNCFNVIHARSVCTSWRSTFPFPHSLLRPSYSLPAFGDFPYVSKGSCTLEKVPLFLFRVQTPAASPSEYFLGGVGRDESVDYMELQYPIQFSVKIPGYEPNVLNIRNSQVFPLGHQYRIMGWDPESWSTKYGGVAFLPLNKEGGEFVLLLNYSMDLLVLRSSEMRWMQLKETSRAQCCHIVAFRGRFYATFVSGDLFIYDPYTLKRTPFAPSPPLRSSKYLVQAGDDELLLVEKFNPFPDAEILDFNRFTCRVSRLDNEADKWVEITDLGDRVLFIRDSGNVCCSAKNLPDGCGVSGNSIVFTNTGYMTYAYKYGVHTGREDDELNIWRFSRENRVTIVNTSPMVAFQVQPETRYRTLDN
ncbi:F-box/kelch-repeat protein At1g64840-like [Raphanus sativus]|uniref:F-box/kelch-repeat protein At1g64840-like n=1 Tax=Raphanus sativus TaxID=3726 RepID=A0A6J0NDV0_RAPSA|nr:F-box/kelch-repeat protein At1g64840-like [Raphanus sativus]